MALTSARLLAVPKNVWKASAIPTPCLKAVCAFSAASGRSRARTHIAITRAAVDPLTDASSSVAEPSESAKLYSRPELYDLAFSYRNFKQEVAFLTKAYAKHTGGAKLTSVLELGCGPARHSIALAQSGIPWVLGMDLCPDMLAYARQQAARANKGVAPKALTLMQGDMRGFEVQGPPLDMVLCLLGSLSHCHTNAAALACFRAVAGALRQGGLFVLELAHPGDLFDGTLIVGDGGREVWEVPMGQQQGSSGGGSSSDGGVSSSSGGCKKGGKGSSSSGAQAPASKLLVEWGAEFDEFDPVSQLLHRTVTLNVFRGEEVCEVLSEVLPFRQFSSQEVDLLAGASGLEVAGLYGEMDPGLGVGLGHEEAYRMVAVLRKA